MSKLHKALKQLKEIDRVLKRAIYNILMQENKRNPDA